MVQRIHGYSHSRRRRGITRKGRGRLAASAGSPVVRKIGSNAPRRPIVLTPATATSGDRTVYVGPNSHKVNVAYGETVRFVAESGNAPERSFAWRFDVIPEGTSVDLSKVAPVDFPSHNVRVIVSPDPLYAGG